jgi:hypothetical protein
MVLQAKVEMNTMGNQSRFQRYQPLLLVTDIP